MRKIIKLLLSAWTINLVVFTSTLFIHGYYDSIGHWSETAWDGILFTSVLTKIVLSICLVASSVDHGIWTKGDD